MTAGGGPPATIGICLSGGGFRATLFGLGVVRYLVEAGHGQAIAAISAVSGGSVAATVLADRWPDVLASSAADAVDQVVTSRVVDVISRLNLRNRGLGRYALRRLRPGGRYGSARGASIVRHLLDTTRLAELPPTLQVVLTSTELSTGRAFRMSQQFIGSWDLGYAPTPRSLGLASAIAASTAVPLVFPPVRLDTRNLGLCCVHGEIALVDGGVYDNLGLEWFQGWSAGRPPAARPCDFVVAVDSSGPIVLQARRFGWPAAIRRSQAIQYQQSRSSRVRWYVEQLMTGKQHGLYIPITADPRAFHPNGRAAAASADVPSGALPVGFAGLLSRLRTDLDCFSRVECELLAYHGYWSTHVRLVHVAPHMALAEPSWSTYARLSAHDAAGLKRKLTQSQGFKLARRRTAP